jgi:mycothiol synthase
VASGDLPLRSTADDDLRDTIIALVGAVEAADGFRPLSDQAWLDAIDGHARGVALVGDDGRLRGWAQVSDDDEPVIESVVEGDVDARVDVVTSMLSAVRAALPGRTLRWWAFAAGPWSDLVADRLGLAPVRDLLQVRISLPAPPTAVTTRPFRVGADEESWLEVNAAAFAGHAEQGRWTLADLLRREHEPWFDPEGFLLHERDGRLAAFCWTKVHDHADGRREGEIYVVAVHPDFHGLGLGRALTLAGLRSLVDRGITDGMLFVDSDNAPAVQLYHSIGFVTDRTDRTYRSCPIVGA